MVPAFKDDISHSNTRTGSRRPAWPPKEVLKIRIGLIDVDGHNFPNLPLMKLSAWHKQQGDTVEWYEPLFHSMGEPFDRVYMSKVFSFTPDYQYYVNAKEVVKGGSGYCISLVDGKEVFDAKRILSCHMRLKQFIQIMRFIMTRHRKSEILLMVF